MPSYLHMTQLGRGRGPRGGLPRRVLWVGYPKLRGRARAAVGGTGVPERQVAVDTDDTGAPPTMPNFGWIAV